MKKQSKKQSKKVENGILYKDAESMINELDIQVNLELSLLDRIRAIEDFFFWCDNEELSPTYIGTFVEYKKFLLRSK